MAEKTRIAREVIELDYKDFKDLELFDCKLVFKGGRRPNFENVHVKDCEFIFEGAADNTLEMLRMIAHSGDAALIVNEVLGLKNWAATDE